jgi:hypothetical protein
MVVKFSTPKFGKLACFLSHCLSVQGRQAFVQGILAEGGRVNTVDLLIIVACFVTQGNNIFSLKMS